MKLPSFQTDDSVPLRPGLYLCARLLLAVGALAVIGILQPVKAASPPFEWANVAGTVNDDYGRAMAVDGAGNTYVAGSIDGMATFGSTNITSSGGSNRPDLFVAKYDAAGLFQWVRRIGGTGTDLAFGIVVDSSSNVVVTGSSDSVPLAIGSSNFLVSGKKVLFVKFDGNGTLLWARVSLPQALFPAPDGVGMAVGSDAAGNLYFAGNFVGGPINFGGTGGTFPPPTGGIAFTNTGQNEDIFLLKYTANGSIVWGRQISGVHLQEAKGIAVTPAGDIYLAGRFNGTTTFGNTNLTSGNTSYDTDVFLGRWDTDGNFQWVTQVGSPDTDYGLATAVDGTGGPYLVGAFGGHLISIGSVTYTNSSTMAPLGSDLFVAKYAAGGALQWSMPIEHRGGGFSGGLGATTDADGNLLITGAANTGTRFKNLDFPPGTGSIFVALIENGDTVWVKRAGTEFFDDWGSGIGRDASGNIYLGGTVFADDPGSLAVFDSITPSMYGRSDIFVAKLGGTAPPNGPTMSFSLAGTSLSVTWPLANADFYLESSTSLSGGFGTATEPRVTNVGAQTITVTILPSGPQQFYRLARP